MEESTDKEYKSLGNTIREAVFAKKDAPTMLPDKTIEKLGLGEDHVLTIEDDDCIDETADTKSLTEEISKNREIVLK